MGLVPDETDVEGYAGGGTDTTNWYEEKYPGMAKGRPEKGWSAQRYGYGDDTILVKTDNWISRTEYESLGLVVFDVFAEDDGESYWAMAPPASDSPKEVESVKSWANQLATDTRHWAVDITSIDWGSYIPGVDVMKDTMDTTGMTANVEVKGRMLKVEFFSGYKSEVKYYEFPSLTELRNFCSQLSDDLGVDIYTSEGPY